MYKCSNCWYTSAVKLWRCPECWKFNTFIEDENKKKSSKKFNKKKTEVFEWNNWENLLKNNKNVDILEKIFTWRNKKNWNFWYYQIESKEIKRILINWIKKWWVYLIWWEPGIWKSTIALKLINELLKKNENIKIVYFSWEELEEQIIERLIRIYPNLKDYLLNWGLNIINTNSLEDIINTINDNELDFVVIDSIQTIESSQVEWVSWWVAQVKFCSDIITQTLKKNKTAWLIIWHLTKWWEVAWPKYLEHIVDVVLYFEWDKYWNFRFLRAKKNRFWPTDEMWIFEMNEKWLIEAENYSNIILENSGWIIWVWIDNWRPIVVPVEAMLTDTYYNYPKRNVIWYNFQRLDLIISILNRFLRLNLSDKDIFINIPWDNIFNDNWLDLAVLASIIYNYKWLKYDWNKVFIWEVNLSWKILKTKLHEKRVKEAKRMWFKEIIDYTKIKELKDILKFI